MSVEIIIGNIESRIVGFISDDVHRDLDKHLSYKMKGVEHSEKVKKGIWDGYTRLYKRGRQSFLTGLYSIVVEILKKHDVSFVKRDTRVRPPENLPNLTFSPPGRYVARDYQQVTIDRAYNRTRGLLKMATGSGKCLGRGTPVMMFSGTTKKVEDVIVGDLLMGPDSKPRKVLSTTSGIGPLYKVEQKNGDDYVCNDAHILCLERTTSPKRDARLKNKIGGKRITITAKEFHEESKWFKHCHKGYKVGVDFPENNIPLSPYWMGLWLGDGNSDSAAITTGDAEISRYIFQFAKDNGMFITVSPGCGCSTYHFVKNKRGVSPARTRGSYTIQTQADWKQSRMNPIVEILTQLGVINNKHIPDCYKFTSAEHRLCLLAGLIDSDGYSSKKGVIGFCNSNYKLASDVCWLARSLGYRASINEKKTSIKSTGYKGISYVVAISGETSKIPLLLSRKQAGDKTKYKAGRYGINVLPIGEGEYFGFEIDGDRRFLLGDFTVTHNTMVATELISKIKTGPFMFYVLTKDLLDQAYDTLSSSLNIPIGRIGGGECDVKMINVCTVQTAIRSINSNVKFNISDYSFDEEDRAWWDEEDITSEEKLEMIRKVISSCKGLFFDETHHAASATAKDVINASPGAYWKFGGSATPYREDGADLMLQALFGKKIVDINASYLIERGFLCEPNIIFEPIHSDMGLHSWKSIYKNCVAKNDTFNNHVAETAKFLMDNGLNTLILVGQKSQGAYIQSLLPGIPFVSSSTPKAKRRQAIQDLRDKKIMGMIATSLADEGLDVPVLGSALLAGGGASATRVNQRIGRTLRPDFDNPDKKPIVIYYEHDAKYLSTHARRVRKILKEEPRFNILKSDGPHAINREIEDLLGLNRKEKNLFD